MNTGAAVIVVAGGGHNTLNVGSEGADFVPFFYNYGINTIILRNRLRATATVPQTDAVNDMLQAIKVVRAYADGLGHRSEEDRRDRILGGRGADGAGGDQIRGVRQDARRGRQSAREDQLASGLRRH